MKEPTISIVIPVFNEQRYLADCLASIKQQTQKPLEVIVVDNNSTDGSLKIAKQFNATIVIEPKQGRSYSRNRGFNAAKGAIIGRIDADTRLPKDWVKNVTKHFSADPKLEGLGGPAQIYDFVGLRLSSISRRYLKATEKLFGHPVLWGANMALTKRAWNKVKGSTCNDDSLVHEDQDLSALIAKAGGKLLIDWELEVMTSWRRFKNPVSLIEYFWRLKKTLKLHGH